MDTENRNHSHSLREVPDSILERTKERFWRHIEKAEGCWIWKGFLTDGYGDFGLCLGPNKWVHSRPHRISYEIHKGVIPPGLQIDHLCRNRACVNPDHLEPVTVRINLLRGVGFAARNASKTICKRGHAFTPDNTRILVTGYRNCRKCLRLLRKKYRMRDRGKVKAGRPRK